MFGRILSQQQLEYFPRHHIYILLTLFLQVREPDILTNWHDIKVFCYCVCSEPVQACDTELKSKRFVFFSLCIEKLAINKTIYLLFPIEIRVTIMSRVCGKDIVEPMWQPLPGMPLIPLSSSVSFHQLPVVVKNRSDQQRKWRNVLLVTCKKDLASPVVQH